MKQLTRVYSGLGRLRLFRSSVRLGAAGSMVLSILLWTLAAAFLLDFWIRMDRLERGILLVAVLGVLLWAFVRYLLPALRTRESDAALAVMVDRQQGMQSDLIAAIQFDDGARRQYGSAELREAVIEYTGEAAGSIDFLEGFSRGELRRRLMVFLVTAAVCVVPGAIFAGHTAAFLNRLFLGRAHYPTRTIIEEVVSPGDRSAYGRPVVFAVRVGGERPLPESGQVRVRTLATGLETTVDLLPDKDRPDLYVGTLSRVLDDLSYTVLVGDARTDPRRLALIPLPLAQFEMKVVTPAYARTKPPTGPKDRRQVVVLEGSKVIPIVTADKELVSATLMVEKTKEKFPMTRRGPGAPGFVLDRDDGPLASVSEVVHFQIDVTDVDGLSPENAIRGVVQVSADLPPRVALGAYSRYVVPQATPELEFRAVDDYALDHLTLHQTIIPAEDHAPAPAAESQPSKMIQSSQVIVRLQEHQADYSGRYTLRLSEMNLHKGDQVVVAVEAVDYRGTAPGKGKRSEKWVFEVTDQEGVLRAMERLTEQMDKKLDEVLRAQLEVGN